VKVYVLPTDSMGCGHYRLVWPAEVAGVHHGWQVAIVPPGKATGIRGHIVTDTEDPREGVLTAVSGPKDADVIVMQRPTNRRIAEAIPHLIDQGIAVVVDMDDDLETIDPANPAWAALHPRRSPEDNWGHARRACRDATLVTVSTPALAERYAPHGRVRVLPNCVPEGYLQAQRADEGTTTPVVGWPGSVHSHPRDLQVMGHAVRTSALPFLAVGPGTQVAEALNLDPDNEEVGATGEVSFGLWSKMVATLDVGLCPLAPSRFNDAKSWLKPLEMSACGVPWIGSPSPEYRRLHEEGIGLLAARPRDWLAALRRLRDPVLRAEMSARGREVAARHTYQGEGWRWAEAWADAASLVRARHRT
jgi:Glycosyl transferases group 1